MNFRQLHFSFSGATLALLVAPLAWCADVPGELEDFFSHHCHECHDDLTAESGLDLMELDFDLSRPDQFRVWEKIFHRVEQGEMPPQDRDRPGEEKKKEFLHVLGSPLLEVDRGLVREKGRVHGRRLTRVEYQHALHDLLGIDLPLILLLPEDEVDHGFETEAAKQQVSHFHLDKYLLAADVALVDAFARVREGDRSYSKHYGVEDFTRRAGGNYRGPEGRGDRAIMWKMGLQFTGRLPATRVPESGWYRVTLENVHGINRGDDGAVWGSLRSGACSSNEPALFYIGSIEAGAEPRDHVYEAWIQGGHMLEVKPNDGTDPNAPTGATGGNVGYEDRDLEEEGFAGISYEGIQVERIYPHAARSEVRRNLWGPVEWEKGKPLIDDPEKEIRGLIGSFASRAFRRPVGKGELEPYWELAEASLKEGGDFENSLKTAYRAILCSPRFLSFVEPVGELDDYSIASRLSFFLWRSIPDAELTKLAQEGRLRDGKVLAAQVERLARDAKFERFLADFTDQWLNLKEIDFTTPDPRRFGAFDPVLQDSMVAETRAFLGELVRKNLSVRNLVSSDFAMVDTRLASHYQLPKNVAKPGKGLQRVSLAEGKRGGLVTQASILKVTADGSTTSPILRGVWINERILGVTPPPPPPNVPAVEPDIRGAVSIRNQLAKHSSDKTCSSCHVAIDPPGFALESYDPIGQWRTAYGTGKGAAEVDSSGVTPNGTPFADIDGWKNIYENKPDLLARAFVSQLIAFSTGAAPRFCDREHLDEIVSTAAKEDYGIMAILNACVSSPVFLAK